MYRMSYAEIVDDDSQERRSREVIAFDHGIDLLTRAAAGDPPTTASIATNNAPRWSSVRY